MSLRSRTSIGRSRRGEGFHQLGRDLGRRRKAVRLREFVQRLAGVGVDASRRPDVETELDQCALRGERQLALVAALRLEKGGDGIGRFGGVGGRRGARTRRLGRNGGGRRRGGGGRRGDRGQRSGVGRGRDAVAVLQRDG